MENSGVIPTPPEIKTCFFASKFKVNSPKGGLSNNSLPTVWLWIFGDTSPFASSFTVIW